MELFTLTSKERERGHIVNKERIYRYRQLLDGINNSIVADIEQSIILSKKCQTLKNFNAAQGYTLMIRGAWLGIRPMINSECTEKEQEALWFYWKSIIIHNYDFD